MKSNVIKLAGLLFVLTMAVLAFTACAANYDGPYYDTGASPYYPQPQGIISPNSQSGVIETPFVDVKTEPVSTFSADVDTASYTLFRKHVQSGYTWSQMQQDYVGGNIRTEEMLNYFDYDYSEPAQGDLFGVGAQIVPCPWNEQSHLLLLGLKAKDAEKPVGNNLVFLIDISGSMNSEDKLPLLQKTFSYLVENLTEQDRVSIVTYASGEHVLLEACPGNQYTEIMHAINSLGAGGSTNGQAGLQRAYEIAESCYIQGGNNRIILASDGDLNVGISNPTELKRFVEEKRESGIYLSVLGFGSGNFRDDNMETLADHGNGVYYYIDGEVEAEKIFGSELCSTLTTVANDVKLQVTFDPELVGKYRLIGYENRRLENDDFEDDTKDAGEVGAGHTLTVCYEIELLNSEPKAESMVATLAVRWKNPGERESREREYGIRGESVKSDPDDDALFAAAVIETAMLLHNSRYRGSASLEEVLSLLAAMQNKDFYQVEFEQLIKELQKNR